MADTGEMRFLKRFPKEKHEQVRQIMGYIEMCGLSGRDLVSIGGWIDRQTLRERYQHARSRVEDYVKSGVIRPIGRDSESQIVNRFKFRTTNGDYNFTSEGGWQTWHVASLATKTIRTVRSTTRDWPAHVKWTRREFYDLVLDISDGKVILNW